MADMDGFTGLLDYPVYVVTTAADGGDHVAFVLSPVGGDTMATQGLPLRLSDVRNVTPGHPA